MTQQASASADALGGWGALMRPTNPTEFWMLAAFIVSLTGVLLAGVLAYFAWKGLRSIKHAQDSLNLAQEQAKREREDVLTRIERDARQSAIDRCNELAREILPMHMEVMSEILAKGVDLFVKSANQVSFNEKEETEKINDAIGWLKRVDAPSRVKLTNVMNRIEGWAMVFTNGLAKESIAVEPCSNVFCQLVMALYPAYLVHRRANPAGGPYQNTVNLYRKWYGQRTKGDLLEQLKRVTSEEVPLPPLLGTSLDEKA